MSVVERRMLELRDSYWVCQDAKRMRGWELAEVGLALIDRSAREQQVQSMYRFLSKSS